MTSKAKPYEPLQFALSPSWKATESKWKAVQSGFLDDERAHGEAQKSQLPRLS